MDLSGLLTLIIIGGLVWGGFIYFLIKAIKFEKAKENE